MCQKNASPAALPVAQDSPSASPPFGGVGPTMCLNVEERFQRNDCCVGVGLPEQCREVGMSALLKGGLGGVARSFAAGALGTL